MSSSVRPVAALGRRAGGDRLEIHAITVNCANLTCSAGSNGVTSNVYLTGFDAPNGVWDGNYTNALGEFGRAALLLSPDKNFAGALACTSGYHSRWLENCEFIAARRR